MAHDPTSKERLTAYQRWELNAFDAKPEEVALPTADQIQRIQQQAYQEGFAAGIKDGRAEGQAIARRIQTIMQSMQSCLTKFEEEMAGEIMNLSLDIARQMVRSALEADPALVLAVVREAIESLPQVLGDEGRSAHQGERPLAVAQRLLLAPHLLERQRGEELGPRVAGVEVDRLPQLDERGVLRSNGHWPPPAWT